MTDATHTAAGRQPQTPCLCALGVHYACIVANRCRCKAEGQHGFARRGAKAASPSDALAQALHDSLPCRWQAHAGFTAKTDAEYHQQQIDRLDLAGYEVRRTDEPDALELLRRCIQWDNHSTRIPEGENDPFTDVRAYLASKEQSDE